MVFRRSCTSYGAVFEYHNHIRNVCDVVDVEKNDNNISCISPEPRNNNLYDAAADEVHALWLVLFVNARRHASLTLELERWTNSMIPCGHGMPALVSIQARGVTHGR